MKPVVLAVALVALCVDILPAQSTDAVIPSTSVSTRDGFTQGKTGILFTYRGESRPVQREVVLDNGLHVRPDGTVQLPNGEKAAIRNNQLLKLDGTFEDVALLPSGAAPVTSAGGTPSSPR